ncbi:RBBP9/YdeN family alpha/beta hydrolase [Lacibacterium aquatile]|uniref:RBBP9/YdeN family alpha/beta hydrolase n=1 Tax=Lacibacterium aquatile TaxID=1168082 RepID=A0ABW5DW50_9PROT
MHDKILFGGKGDFMARYLILPGLGNSGPEHWQSIWEASGPEFVRVQQSDWENPKRADWIAAIADAVRVNPGAILICHSLACAALAHTLAVHPDLPVKAALLVAPADCDDPNFTPDEVRDFAPMPLARLPFPVLVVASIDDTYVSLARAKFFAKAWGGTCIDIGPRGHINSASNLGDWLQGRELLARIEGVRVADLEAPRQVVSQIYWPDSNFLELSMDHETLRLKIQDTNKKPYVLECWGYIGYQAAGVWEEGVIESVHLSQEDTFLLDCISRLGRPHNTDSDYRNRREFFCLIINLIDGSQFKFVQNSIVLVEG